MRDAAVGLAEHRSDLPAWARWNPAAAERPWTVGVEEEVMLLDARTCAVANRVEDALALLPPALSASASRETHACVLELRTDPSERVAGVAAQLETLRAAMSDVLLDQLGLRPAAAGTHPLATRSEVGVSRAVRYAQIEETMRALARREPTMALHVHVAVPDGATAVRALDGVRGELPLLLALSANSPFWRGADSGFASIRTPLFSMFPRVGIPRRFGSYDTYVQVVEGMLRSDAIPDPSFLWWDARLQPRYGTVEVRIMDAQSRVADVAALAAIVQCLVRLHGSAGRPPSTLEPETLAENRFLAARDGMDVALIEEGGARRRPGRRALDELLHACATTAATLGCTAELAGAHALGLDRGDARQRRTAAAHGIAAVPAQLSEEFVVTSHPAEAITVAEFIPAG